MELKKDRKRIEIIKPFGPSVIKFQMPVELINEINSYIDNIILDNSKIEKEVKKEIVDLCAAFPIYKN